ncbi:uncharacterized protein LOC127263210 isoform X2 [Andrographis paniculata]|nr:uncharacterized protein LOC127263210 isoform X2 [Andrographis paniculata]
MDRSGKKIDFCGKMQRTAKQVWKAVSTQASLNSEGDNRTTDRQNRPGEVHEAVSSNVSTSTGGGNRPEVLIEKASGRATSSYAKAAKSREDFSHFVSLPLAFHSGLLDKLVSFQNEILGIEGLDENSGVEKSVFINPKTLHLTVLMLKLWDKERVKTAAEVLQNVSSKVIEALENRPVSIKLKGLECMKGSVTKARVVYAPVEEVGGKGRLLRACDVIIKAFVEAGLVEESDAQQKLKLHATLMNGRFRKRARGKRWVDSFDARGIFERHGSYEWGEYVIREAHLSQRFVYDENGYYHRCSMIPFSN